MAEPSELTEEDRRRVVTIEDLKIILREERPWWVPHEFVNKVLHEARLSSFECEKKKKERAATARIGNSGTIS